MKKLLLWLLIASVFITGGCSYIEHTQGADFNRKQTENGIAGEKGTTAPSTVIKHDSDMVKQPDDPGKVQSQDPDNDEVKHDSSPSQQAAGPENSDDTGEKASLLRVHFIDVGQGDSILIESDNNYMLIDAGESYKSNDVIDYLDDIGVKKLDYIIATHPHSDHIGGLADVINHFSVGKIIMPDVVHTSRTFENLLDTIAENGLKITKAVVGSKYSLGNASFVILAPNSSDYDSLNNYSVAIKLQNGKNSFIFAGDAEVPSENEMLKNDIDLDADVLKLGHHGSTTSSSDKFLDAVTPDIAVISVGTGNQYGHPHAEILKTLKDRKIKLFRTDKQGTIILESDGSKITANTDPYKISDKDLKSITDNEVSSKAKSSADKSETDTGKTDTSKTGSEKADTIKSNTGKSDSNTDKSKSNTADKKDNAKNIIVHITATGSKYHRAGCRYLSKSDIEVTLEEALSKGLTPCKTCKPPTN